MEPAAPAEGGVVFACAFLFNLLHALLLYLTQCLLIPQEVPIFKLSVFFFRPSNAILASFAADRPLASRARRQHASLTLGVRAAPPGAATEHRLASPAALYPCHHAAAAAAAAASC